MEMMKGVIVLAISLMVLDLGAYAQVPTSPCTSSMLSSFTPCVNYLTNSSGTGSSPTTDCCNSLRNLMSNGTDCICQIVTGGVPFRLPINRTTAISLPRACNQPGVPLQCKASPGAPVPAPGPVAFGPSASPASSISPSPVGTVPTSDTPALAPVSDANPTLTPPSTVEGGSLPPTSTSTGTGSGSSLNPSDSAAMPSLSISPAVLLSAVAVMMMKYF
ncbi:non-specific lipid transfer protein GPI-anchored 2-like [Chenopodium quinoa]|uniref:Bifunctional inhibitor/plant lipid transfer protein/seed storage helical domain-containing protein n=1 Tax=Chenopodium quinoa TaxID=63459 RepID=A0A803MQW3_CHEQI|nr:non-specific lipid transfer protein GPI-anchored 2-like [Chenopodium quinoa]